MCENECSEYIEDPYIPKLENCVTPSLDEITECDHKCVDNCNNCEWPDDTEFFLRSLTLDQIFFDVPAFDDLQELQVVETEFGKQVKNINQSRTLSIAKGWRLKFFTKKTVRDVKVTFTDFSKPYLARISSSENYKKFLNIGGKNERSIWKVGSRF